MVLRILSLSNSSLDSYPQEPHRSRRSPENTSSEVSSASSDRLVDSPFRLSCRIQRRRKQDWLRMSGCPRKAAAIFAVLRSPHRSGVCRGTPSPVDYVRERIRVHFDGLAALLDGVVIPMCDKKKFRQIRVDDKRQRIQVFCLSHFRERFVISAQYTEMPGIPMLK